MKRSVLLVLILALPAAAVAQVERTVDVGGHRLFYQFQARGTPTVVIDVGVGESYQSWSVLVADLSKTVSVLVYDRAGYGRSEMGPLPRNAKAEAADLRALLQKANVKGPYVLVGHSLGGLNMQVFAHDFPADVAGLVLLDPPPRGWLAGGAFAGLKQMFLRVTEDMAKAAAAAERSRAEQEKRQAPFLRTVASEHEEMFGNTAHQVLAVTSFGNLRMVVIASGRTNPMFGEEADAYQKYWIEESRKLARLSTSGEFVLAEQSSHQIHRDAPQLVLDAIRKLLLNGSSRLPSPRSESVQQAVPWKTLAGETRTADISTVFLRRLLDNPGARALTVAVVQDAKVVYHEVMGVVDPGTKRAANAQTVFRGASLSKPVFAYLVMKLAGEGVIDLDKPLVQYLDRPLPEFPDYRDLKDDDRYRLLTARIILSQRSGFPNWRVMNPGRRLDFKFTPGERFKYSGEGYRLLQMVLEQITRKPFNDLAGEKVFGPLEMANSSYLWERRFDGNFAVDLNTDLGPLIQRTKTVPNSAGSLLSNAADYAAFLLAAVRGQGLGPKSVETMFKRYVGVTSKSLHAEQGTDPAIREKIDLGWGLGWGRFRCPAGEAIFHTGREEGCDCYAVYFLDRGLGLIVFSVTDESAPVVPAIAKEFLGDVFSPFAWLMYD
jgi:CubicO group peptidase (beta-lactamase class C family)/pimeloyl-ACP methyl ester carboxylesterase